jgi:hypothetical protein
MLTGSSDLVVKSEIRKIQMGRKALQIIGAEKMSRQQMPVQNALGLSGGIASSVQDKCRIRIGFMEERKRKMLGKNPGIRILRFNIKLTPNVVFATTLKRWLLRLAILQHAVSTSLLGGLERKFGRRGGWRILIFFSTAMMR